MKALLPAAILLASLLAGCASPPAATPDSLPAQDLARDDVVVIAVIDDRFDPYHHDFLASQMPQAQNGDPTDDLPLDQDPATWLPGHPGASAFASHAPLDLTLPQGAKEVPAKLHDKDADAWGKVPASTPAEVHMRWIPGTKVVGFVNFGGNDGFSPASHGVGTTSVSVGNLHGTCPHCLLVFVNGFSEQANRWVESQDWIDAQTNSWGASFTGVARDRLYAGSDVASQRGAVDRGQSIFFSAGNGIDGAFVATNPTLFSSQEGPDWITTVGAILPSGTSPGSGKPADVAAPGSAYPSAGGKTVSDNATFGGTSNATPVTAGLYGEALYRLRREMAGPSRVQSNGTVSEGGAGCGGADSECALADGRLTVHELREALFGGARHTEQGYSVAGVGLPGTENQAELTYLAEGHGSYWGRMEGEEAYLAEVARIVDHAAGRALEAQDPTLTAWMVADSLCRQSGWGAWEHGYAQQGHPVPAPDPQWPVRTWLTEACPQVLPQAVQLIAMLPSPFTLLP